MSMRGDSGRHDDAARAGWLYYVAGNTQDQIAAKLGVSRQSAQRLVSLAVSEGLVKVRLDHPIANCLDLAAKLQARFALDLVRGGAERPGFGIDDAWHCRSGRRRNRKAVEVARSHRSCHRHGPHAEGGDRTADADGMPAAQAGFADRKHRAGRLGRLSTTSSSPWPTRSRRAAFRCRCPSSPPRSRNARCCCRSR